MNHGGSWVFPIAFAPYSTSDLTEIVSGSDGGTIKVWTIDLTKETPDVSLDSVDSSAVYSLAWSPPDGSMIVAGGDGDITVYDAATLNIIFQTVNAHVGRVNDVAFSPDGDWIVSGGADGALKLWYLGAQ
jgi:WD40 repeat protein